MSYPIVFDASEKKWTPAIAGRAIAGITTVGSLYKNDPFSSLGLGTLVDAISCTVSEERNGSYELEMQYSITGIHFEELKQRNLILAKPNYYDPPQPFRIYKITKPLNKICTIYARHISYDLSGYEVEGNLTAHGASLALELLNQRAQNFNVSGQVTGSSEFKTDVPASVRSWFGGKEGSLIDLYGGEWHYNGYDCNLMVNRGEDRGVTIRYGKNLTTLAQDEECSNVYSAVRAYYQNTQDETLAISDLVGTGIELSPERIFFLDCSSDFQEQPTVEQLHERAVAYIRSNNLKTPSINLTLDFVQMQGFDRVDLCDIVTVQFEELGVSARAKCIKTTWNVLDDRYDEITLGDAKSTFSETVKTLSHENIQASLKKTTDELISAIDKATEMITGNLGGYVVLHDSDDDGYPDEILIMDEPSIEDAVNIWRWNKSGLGFSSTGYTGDFGLAMTADGQIVADYITAGTMSANMIRGGTLVAGGYNNQNGVIEVLDSSGNLVGQWDNDGIYMDAGTSNYMKLSSNGYELRLNSGAKVLSETFTHLGTSGNAFPWNIALGCLEAVYDNNVRQWESYWAPTILKISRRVGSSSEASFSVSASKIEMVVNNGQRQFLFDGETGQSYLYADRFLVSGSFQVQGSKSRQVETKDYAKRLLYCYETPSPMFGDVGEGVIGEDGLCYVWLDPIFAETIATNQYQVFLQKYGSGECYVKERHPGYFIVAGDPSLAFGWELKSKQADFAQKRLDPEFDTRLPQQIAYGDEAINHLCELKEGRLIA